MNWKKLKDNKCPKCGSFPLISAGKFYKCQNWMKGCTFMIGTDRFNQVVKNLYAKPSYRPSEDDNMSELNNL